MLARAGAGSREETDPFLLRCVARCQALNQVSGCLPLVRVFVFLPGVGWRGQDGGVQGRALAVDDSVA